MLTFILAMYPADTIVAPATPPGRGAVAIIRLSGPDAITIAHALWHPLKRSQDVAPRELRLGEIRAPDTQFVLDRAMCVVFPGPRSLTGEDIAELHCHGGPYLVRRILGLAADRGARIAEPGEFTRRAYLNGRLDLPAAEAIADLIDARGENALAQAVAQLSGALSARVDSLRGRLVALRAHLEAEIDFSDEDLDLPSRGQLTRDLDQIGVDLHLLHDSFVRGRLARDGVRIAIIGKPNAGKSSILNLMLGADRAIVTSIPGTTRDVIEDTLSLGSYALVLQDTAGLRDSHDEVEQIGIARTRRSAQDADLLIAVFDSARSFEHDDAHTIALTNGRFGIALLNKRDLPQSLSSGELRANGLTLPILDFSATTTEGLDQLREELLGAIETLAGDDNSISNIPISRERHRAALAQALDALAATRTSLCVSMPPEIIAVDLTLATEALASLTGAISNEDILDTVFREFCIGK
jgi:tRNA modification GTPase